MKQFTLAIYTILFSLWLPTATDLCRYERQNALWKIGGRLSRSEGLPILEQHAAIISEWAKTQDPCTKQAYIDWIEFFTADSYPPEFIPWKYK